MQFLHHTNIVIHVIAGTLALCLGIVAAIVYKRTKWHVKIGRRFVWMMCTVVITGLVGIIVFQRNSFLLVITMLSGYNSFSGIRAMRLKGQKPVAIDLIFPLMLIFAGGAYLYRLQFSTLYWSPVVVYSTLGAVLFIAVYDLSKRWHPFNFRVKATRYEHAYKMISALSGLASAFAGTVLPMYHPYSQFMPSVMGLCWIVITFIQLSKHTKLKQKHMVEEKISAV
jgi:hypothetical protein